MTTAGFPHSDTLGSTFGCQLPEAYRRLLRPSSAPDAKASTMRPYTLDHHTPPTTENNPQRTTRDASAEQNPHHKDSEPPHPHPHRREHPQRRTPRQGKQEQRSASSEDYLLDEHHYMMLASTVQFSNDNQAPPAHQQTPDTGENTPTGMTCHRRPEEKKQTPQPAAGSSPTPLQCPVPQDPTVRQAPGADEHAAFQTPAKAEAVLTSVFDTWCRVDVPPSSTGPQTFAGRNRSTPPTPQEEDERVDAP